MRRATPTLACAVAAIVVAASALGARPARAQATFIIPPINLLYQNFPNPFPSTASPVTCIWFDLAQRSEGVTLVVASSFGKRDWALTEQSRQRAEERRLRVHRGLERLCAELHVDYLGRALPRYREFGPEDTRLLGRDAFHRNAEGHRDNVDEKFQILLPICRKAQEGRDARASEGVTKGGFESEKVAKNSHSW